jgi:hypothetical protein
MYVSSVENNFIFVTCVVIYKASDVQVNLTFCVYVRFIVFHPVVFFIKNIFFKSNMVYSTEQKAFMAESYFRNGRKVND